LNEQLEQALDQIAEEKIRARQEAEYEDHLKAQQDIDNPFGSLSDDGYSSDHLNDTGFYEASDDIKREVAALSSLAEQHGIDIAGIQFDTALQSPNNTGNEFYEKYKSVSHRIFKSGNIIFIVKKRKNTDDLYDVLTCYIYDKENYEKYKNTVLPRSEIYEKISFLKKRYKNKN
jgi:hypothetical protein